VGAPPPRRRPGVGDMDLSVGAPRLDGVWAWGLQRHIMTLECANKAHVKGWIRPPLRIMRCVGAPRLDGVRAWWEMDLSMGAPRLDAVRAWGMHMHIIAFEWANTAQVNVGYVPC
jgi:hypothetical protein